MNKLDPSRLLGFRIAQGASAPTAKNGFVSKTRGLGAKNSITKASAIGAKNGGPVKPLVLGARNGFISKP